MYLFSLFKNNSAQKSNLQQSSYIYNFITKTIFFNSTVVKNVGPWVTDEKFILYFSEASIANSRRKYNITNWELVLLFELRLICV